MASTFRRVLEWYRAPRQELLRWEVARCRRMAARPAAMAFLGAALLFTGIRVVDNYIGIKRYVAQLSGGSVAPPQAWVGAVSQVGALAVYLLPAVAAGFLAWRRSLSPFRQGRLGDLALTRLEPREIWPALLAAPILAAMAMFGIRWLGDIVAWLIRPELPLHDVYMTVELTTIAAVRSAVGALGLLAPIIGGAVHYSALAAMACAFTLPRRTLGAFAGGVALALLVCGELPSLALIALFFSGFSGGALASVAISLYSSYPMLIVLAGAGYLGARRLWKAERRTPRAAMLILILIIFSGFLAPIWEWFFGTAAARAAAAGGISPVVYVYNWIVLPLFRFAFDLAAFALAVRRLRSPALWERLREEAGRD